MDEIRYGVIGTGMMGVEHIRNLGALDGATVTAIADPHPPSRADARAALGDRAVAEFDSAGELLDAECCDAVVVASPNMTHAAVMDEVLSRDGIHVLIEKPLCTTVADCRRVLDAARGRTGIVWVGLEYRYMPPIARLIAEVDAGTIGSPRMVAVREHRFPFLSKVGDWNRFNRNTGGTLVEKACHFFDLMRRVVGANPTRVMASGGQDVNHLEEVYDAETPDILDNAFVIVDFDSGARAMLDLCMFAEATRHMEEVVVVGDAGKLEAHLPDGTLRVGRRGEHFVGDVETIEVHDDAIAYDGFHHGSSYLEHLAFMSAIRSGSAPEVSLDDGLMSVALGVAAQQSIAEARVVTVDEVVRGPHRV